MFSSQDGDLIVGSVVGGEGPHHSQPVGPLGQLRERAAKPNAGHFGLNFPRATAVVVGDIELWIERLDLWRSALQKQKDDRLALVGTLARRGLAATAEKKLFAFSMGQHRVFRRVFDKRVYPETLDVFHSNACGSEESGVLADLSFYRIDRGATMPQLGFYGLQGLAKPPRLIAEALAEQFGPKQVVERLVDAAKSSSFLSISGRGFAHMLIDDLPTDNAIDKVTFLLGVKTVEVPALLTLRIHDPLDPAREIMSADFMVKGEGLHIITLDTPDIVLLPGAAPTALWISVGSNKGIAIRVPGRFCYPGLLRIAGDELHCYFLSIEGKYVVDGVNNAICMTKSHDEGKTWSNPVPITGKGQGCWKSPGPLNEPPGASNYRAPWPILLDDGRILVLFNRRRMPVGIGGVVTADGGKTWSHEFALRDDGVAEGDSGYPVGCQFEDGRIFVAYYFTMPDGNNFGGTR